MKIGKRDFIFILCIVSLLLIFFGPLIFDSLTFYYRDIFRYYHPTKFFASESVQNGQIPFWNPYNYCGMPFLATLQQALFYPLSLLCYLLPFNLGFKFFFIMHFLLGGIFIYLLCRHLKLDEFCSFVSSIIFIFSGYLISTLNLLTTLSAVIWAPLIFLFFKIAVEKRKTFFSILVGILLSFQFFAGQPDVVFTTLLMLALFLIYKIVIVFHNKYQRIKKEDYYAMMKMFIPLLISIVCFFLLIAIQGISFKELISYTARSSVATFEQVTYWSLHPLELIVLVIPSFSRDLLAGSVHWFGQIWLRNFYIGILPLVLILLSLRFKKKENLYFFITLGIVSLILTLGKFTPFYSFLFKFIPGFNLIRYPVKFIFLMIFSLTILSGIGLQYFIDELKKCKDFSLFIKRMLVVFLGISFGFLLFYFRQERIAELFRNYFLGSITEHEITMFKTRFPRVVRDCFFMLIFLGANLILFSLVSRAKIKLNKFKYLYVILLFISLGIVSYNIEPHVKIEFYNDKEEGNLQFIKQVNQNYGRFYLTPKTEHAVTHTVSYLGYTYYDALLHRRDAILSNTGLPYHLFDVKGYGSMRLKRYNNFMVLVGSQPSPNDSPLINLLNIKYLISLWDIDGFQFKLVRTDYAKVYENQYCLPRVLIVPQSVVITEENMIARKLGDKNFDPTKEVIIESQASSFNPQASGHKLRNLAKGRGKARITCYEANEVDIEADLTQPGWLLLTDTYYPGWKVYIDGQQGEIYQADYLFRAVYLNSGKHKVNFIYEPTLFRTGLAITLLTILALGIIGGYYLAYLVKRKNETTK